MKNKDESYKKFVESLWIEINRAILSSPNVKSSLAHLQELGLLKEVSEYNLVVDVKKLVGMLLDHPESDKKLLMPQKSADTQDSHCKPSDERDRIVRQYIDGKPLTKSQIFFQEYLEHKFDMEAWLKKARVRF